MDGWRHASWKVMAMLALIGGLLLVIVACGGDDEEETPAPAPTAAPVDISAMADQMACLLYTSPSPRDRTRSRMPSSA